MRLIVTIALAALLGLLASPSRAQALDKPVAGCRAFLEHAESMEPGEVGQCAGAVDALLYIGEVLEPDYRFCVPLRTTRREVISGILEDIDALRPDVDRQDFRGMVIEILRYRWPCRE